MANSKAEGRPNANSKAEQRSEAERNSKRNSRKSSLKSRLAKEKSSRTGVSRQKAKGSKAPGAQGGDLIQLRLAENIWPAERNVLFRPDRLKYVRKLIQPKGCVFCECAQSEISIETLCVYKSKHAMVVLNKFPYNSGHVLVIPQRHCGDMLTLSDEEFTDLQNLVRLTMAAVQACYEPGGINLGLNHGAVAGAGIPDHLHYHIIPRWTGDLNFFPLVAETKVVVESLENSFDRLLSYFKTRK